MAVMEIPERRIDVVPVTDQRHNRHFQKLAQLPERSGQYGGRSAQGIACFRINDEHIILLYGCDEVADQGDVIRKFPFADTAHVPKKVFSPDKTVDGDDIICAVRKDRPRRDFKVEKGIVVAEQKIRRFQMLRSRLFDDAAVHDHGRLADKKGKGTEIPFRRSGRKGHIEPFNSLIHTGLLSEAEKKG